MTYVRFVDVLKDQVQIAAAHGGEILLESEVDKGTRFVVRVPRRRVAPKIVARKDRPVCSDFSPAGGLTTPRTEADDDREKDDPDRG